MLINEYAKSRLFNHRVGINKTLSAIISKKDAKSRGYREYYLPKSKLSEMTQKVAKMIGITLLVYGSPAFNPVTTGL